MVLKLPKCCSSHPSLLCQDRTVHQMPEASNRTNARGSAAGPHGGQGMSKPWQLAVWRAKFHSFSNRRVRLHPSERRCAHTLTLCLTLTHSLLSGLTLTFLSETMCSPEAHDCDVWLFTNTSMLNAFPALQRNIS